MKIIPKCIKTKRHLCASGSILLPLAQKWGLVGVVAVAALSALGAQTVSAASLSISVPTSGALSFNVSPTATGAFAESSPASVTVKATADFGYTFTVKAKDNQNVLTNKETSATIRSITGPLAANASSWPVNTWGYKPSKKDGIANNNYLPGPTTGDTIDNISAAQSNTSATYTFQIGTKVDTTIPTGTYSNTFVFTATANAVQYSITYNNCVSNTTTNCPVDVDKQSSTEKSVYLENKTPSRIGYSFKGWCAQETEDQNCPGQTYQPNGSYSLTSSANSLKLYAMWEPETKYLGNLGNMQDFKCSEKIIEQDYYGYVTDVRDSKIYTVAKLKDDQCWMTRNLAIGSNQKAMTLNSDTSDVASDFTLPQGTTSSGPAGKGPGLSGWNDQQYNTANFYINENGVEYGGYYTWFAATAGEGTYEKADGNTTHSICSSGWRLPSKEDFLAIIGKYDITTIQQSPANFTKTGFCSSTGCPTGIGGSTVWWSSSTWNAANLNHEYAADFLMSTRLSQGGYYKGVGRHVRCISRE